MFTFHGEEWELDKYLVFGSETIRKICFGEETTTSLLEDHEKYLSCLEDIQMFGALIMLFTNNKR